jgi:hypothetical protein
MKINKSIIWSLVIMTVVLALYRVIPGRPFGFAPQWALALFSGAIVKDKKWAFALPLLSMFISDLIYQVLYVSGMSSIYGFYPDQWINYLLFTSVTVFGFFIKRASVANVFLGSLAGPTWFFLVSNFLVWMGVGGFNMYPKTWDGLMNCYAAGLLFYKNSLIATVLFSALLFGSWYFINRRSAKPVVAA